MQGTSEQVDYWFRTGIAAGQTVYSKTFKVNNWGQKIFMISATQQVTVTIYYTHNAEFEPEQSEFLPLSTASGAVLAANTIIPFGVEDPVHFVKVEIITGLPASTDVKVSVFGSR